MSIGVFIRNYGKPSLLQHMVDAINAQLNIIQYGSIEIPHHVGVCTLLLHMQ